MAATHVTVCKSPSGRIHRISAAGPDKGVMQGVLIDGMPHGEDLDVALFVRAAATDRVVLVVFRGRDTNHAYAVTNRGKSLDLGAVVQNYSQIVRANPDGTFTVLISGSFAYTKIVLSEDCRIVVPREPHIAKESAQGFIGMDGDTPIWTDDRKPIVLGGEAFHNWTQHDGYTVGLKGDPNWVLVYQHSTDRLFTIDRDDVKLHPQFVTTPTGLIVACSRDGGVFADESDLEPLVDEPDPLPPSPPPPPPPEPTPVPQIDVTPFLVDRTDVVEAVKRDYPHLRGGEVVDQVAHRLNRLHGLRGDRIVFGRKARQADGGRPNEDVVAIRRSYDDVSQKAMVDVLINAFPGDPNNPDKPVDVPTWDVVPAHEEPGNGFWRPPVAGDLDVIPAPDPEPPSPPPPVPDPPLPVPPSPSPDVLARLTQIQAHLVVISEQLSALSKEVALELDEVIKTLDSDYEGSGQLFGMTIPFTMRRKR